MWAGRAKAESGSKDPACQFIHDMKSVNCYQLPYSPRPPSCCAPACRHTQRDKPCYAFLYSPGGEALTEQLVASIRQHNDPPIPEGRVLGMRGTEEVRQGPDHTGPRPLVLSYTG